MRAPDQGFLQHAPALGARDHDEGVADGEGRIGAGYAGDPPGIEDEGDERLRGQAGSRGAWRPTTGEVSERRTSTSSRPWCSCITGTSEVTGSSCSIWARIASVAETVVSMPRFREEERVRGVVDAGEHAGDAPVAGDVADDEVVLVVTRDGGDEVGAGDAGAVEDGGLAGIALEHSALQLVVDSRPRARYSAR